MPDPKVPGEMTGKMMPLSERLAREKEFSKELVAVKSLPNELQKKLSYPIRAIFKKEYGVLPESTRKFMLKKIMEKNKANFLKNNKADYLKGK